MVRVNYLTHYYKLGTIPFRSLSALSDKEAIKIMKELYVDNSMWDRFKEPAQYLQQRKETELWLRKEFISKGGCPLDEYPIYMVLGVSDFIEKNMISEKLSKIQIPISDIKEEEVSFTFVDSMFSFSLGRDKPIEYYREEYHGKVFTLSEILSIVKDKGSPVNGWWGNIPDGHIPYIEAQVWNHKLLNDIYYEMSVCK